jgi:glutathionyl-hydroquinone reductase
MKKKNSRTVATRLSLNELAKARDGLIARGIKEADIQTASQILRLSVYFTILGCNEPKAPPSQESTDFIRQLWNQTKITKNITLDEVESL